MKNNIDDKYIREQLSLAYLKGYKDAMAFTVSEMKHYKDSQEQIDKILSLQKQRKDP